MKTARLGVHGIAIAAGGTAAYLAGRSDDAPAPPPAPPVAANTAEVLTAKKDTNIGQTIGAQDMQWVAWPTSAANPLYLCRSEHPDAVEQLSDIVEPRAETPPYAARRDSVFDKYKKGKSPGTVYPDADKGRITNVAK